MTGCLIGTIVFFALTALFALICLKKDFPQSSYRIVMLIFGAISGFLCGFISVKPIKKRGMITGALCAIPLFLAVISVSVFFNHTGLSGISWIFLGISLLFSALGGVLAANKKR